MDLKNEMSAPTLFPIPYGIAATREEWIQVDLQVEWFWLRRTRHHTAHVAKTGFLRLSPIPWCPIGHLDLPPQPHTTQEMDCF